MSLMDTNFDLLSRALDATAARHRTVSSNLANINTPNYRAKEVSFERSFQEALRKGDVRGAMSARPEVIEREGAAVKADGNSVHLEAEFGEMQKNRLAFDAYSAILRQRLALVKRAIGSAR